MLLCGCRTSCLHVTISDIQSHRLFSQLDSILIDRIKNTTHAHVHRGSTQKLQTLKDRKHEQLLLLTSDTKSASVVYMDRAYTGCRRSAAGRVQS